MGVVGTTVTPRGPSCLRLPLCALPRAVHTRRSETVIRALRQEAGKTQPPIAARRAERQPAGPLAAWLAEPPRQHRSRSRPAGGIAPVQHLEPLTPHNALLSVSDSSELGQEVASQRLRLLQPLTCRGHTPLPVGRVVPGPGRGQHRSVLGAVRAGLAVAAPAPRLPATHRAAALPPTGRTPVPRSAAAAAQREGWHAPAVRC